MYLGLKAKSKGLKYLVANLSLDDKKIIHSVVNKKLKIANLKSKNCFLYIKAIDIDKDNLLVYLQDITAQEKLKQTRKDNTNMMVHDLRAPLTVIKDVADVLIKRGKELKNSQKDEMLVDIKSSAQTLLNSVNNLLDVAKIESDEFIVSKNLQDFGKFVRLKSEHFKSVVKKRGIEFFVKVPKQSVYAEFDPILLERVLNNLISNANKYTKKGSIEVKMETKGKKAVVSIKDTGIGMSSKRKKELFSKFIQPGKPVSKSFKSSGLGLVIAKSIIEKHKGTINVKSSEGRGSTFTFTLPLSEK